jgi:DNA-directed RNA polymerase specialized sigma24 family protein
MVRACGVGAPHPDADDLTQEVWIAMVRSGAAFVAPPGGDAEVAWRAFVLGIARHVVAYHRRAQAHQRDSERGAVAREERDSQPSAEDMALAHTPIVLLRDAVAELEQTAPHLAALLLAYLAEAPIAETAAALGIPEGTGWNRLGRARRAVIAAVRRSLVRDEWQEQRRSFDHDD